MKSLTYETVLSLLEDWSQEAAEGGPGAVTVWPSGVLQWKVNMANQIFLENYNHDTVVIARADLMESLRRAYIDGRSHEATRWFSVVDTPPNKIFEDSESFKEFSKNYSGKGDGDDSMSELRGVNEGTTGERRIKVVLSRLRVFRGKGK